MSSVENLIRAIVALAVGFSLLVGDVVFAADPNPAAKIVGKEKPDIPAEASALSQGLVGPLVGHISDSEAWIWAHAGAGAELTVRYRPEGALPSEAKIVAMPAPAENHFAAKAHLTGLEPLKSYEYEVLRNGASKPAWSGKFHTAPKPGQPGKLKIAAASCMRYDRQPIQPSWYLLLAEKPDLQLLIGDNVYADTTNREFLWMRHLRQRSVTEFAAAIRNIPTYGMWDDHDYGPNNSDGTAKGKEESLRAFKELFANPSAGTPDTPGAFYRFSYGDVDFFMLDGRYHRSPDDAPNDDKKTMLGEAQFQWLSNGLKSSKAKFKVLASGSTMRASRDDGWRVYDHDRKRLYRLIAESKIGGVLYLSGDIHRCQIDVHSKKETGAYDLYEVVSSGIANSETRGFATLEFDTQASDPTIRMRIHLGDATVPIDKTIKLSQMQVE